MRFSTFLAAAGLAAALVPAAASAQDAALWSGFYAGLQANIISPSFELIPIPLDTGTGLGIYGGYNHALGDNFVVGGEISYNAETDIGSVFFPVTMDNAITLRGRAGYAVGNVLAYASLGYVWADVSFGPAPGIDLDAEGMIYGIGLEAMLAENISMRIEYTQSDLDLSSTIPLPPGFSVQADTVSIGVAYHF